MKPLLFLLFLTSKSFEENLNTMAGNVTDIEIAQAVIDMKFIDINPNDVKFLLFEPNATAPVVITSNNVSLAPNLPLKVIIHGWTHNGTYRWIVKMTEFLHQALNCTTISVDWGIIAAKDYIMSASSSKAVGQVIASFLNKTKVPPSQVHLIGHSLGAQISGFTGKNYPGLARISALDPAAPLFSYPPRPKSDKLVAGDAIFVDVIHCQILLRGVTMPLGSANFYVNGGLQQPDCIDSNKTGLSTASCNHQMCHTYYSLTILYPEKYPVTRGPISRIDNTSMVFMGFWVGNDTKGSYRVKTNSTGLNPILDF